MHRYTKVMSQFNGLPIYAQANLKTRILFKIPTVPDSTIAEFRIGKVYMYSR